MSQKSSIEWADKTFNPINGRCPNNCKDLEGEPYCYMWRKGGIADRFKKVHEHPLHLDENILAKIPKKGRVFVGSSTDMWVDSVPDEWILNTLIKCQSHKSREALFFFLTKNAMRYFRLLLSEYAADRMWFGTTFDGTSQTAMNVNTIGNLSLLGFNTFISFEPLLADPLLQFISLSYSQIKWIIIGADSRKGKPKPPKEWADYLIADARMNNAKVFIKDNYGYPEVIKEMPFVWESGTA